MNAELAQLVALVGHGNTFLHGQREPRELFGSNWTFDYVHSVQFQMPDATETFSGTAPWFTHLRVLGYQSLSLAVEASMPAHAPAFSGGGDWHIHAHGATKSGAWYGGWEYSDEDRANPWRVTYVPIPCQLQHGTPIPRAAKERLGRALREAEAFDRRANVGFVDSLAQAQERLESREPETPISRDLLPRDGYELEARQLLAAAARAWVFGGMGWWNDFSPEDDEIVQEHERVTQDLFPAVLIAILSATNAFRA